MFELSYVEKEAFQGEFQTRDDKIVVDSRDIATHFGRRHGDVLRAIRDLGCSDEFRLLNFKPADYEDRNGDVQPRYEITKNGFVLLVMGFTGHDAMKLKEGCLTTFDAMELAIKTKGENMLAYATKKLENDRATFDKKSKMIVKLRIEHAMIEIARIADEDSKSFSRTCADKGKISLLARQFLKKIRG